MYTEFWQKYLKLQKGQETLHMTGKNKRKKEREGHMMGLALLRGSSERGKESAPGDTKDNQMEGR